MIIPIGPLVELIEKLARRSNTDDEEPSYEQRLHQVAIMRTAAARLGAELKEFSRTFVLLVAGVRVEVRFFVADGAIQRMRWLTSGPAPGFPVFRIMKKGPFAFMRKTAPPGTVPHLEGHYLVQTNDGEAVSRMWTEDVCQMLARMSASAFAKSDGTTLEITCAASGHPDVLDAGVKLCVECARSDVYAASLLRDIPGANVVEQQLPFAQLPGPGAIRVGFARVDDRITMKARAAIGSLTDDTAARARELGGTAALENGELVISWPGVIREKARLLAAVELLQQVTSASDGAYR